MGGFGWWGRVNEEWPTLGLGVPSPRGEQAHDNPWFKPLPYLTHTPLRAAFQRPLYSHLSTSRLETGGVSTLWSVA